MSEPITLAVPDPYRGGLQILEGLSEASWESLLAGLEELSTRADFDKLLRLASLYIVDADEAQLMFDVIVSLADYRIGEGWPADVAGRAVAEAVGSTSTSLLSERVATLLNVGVIKSQAAARRSLTTVAHRVSEISLATMVRPVTEASDPGSQALLVHDLRLGYHADGAVRSINVTLDPPALRDLLAAAKRAVKHEMALRNHLAGVFDILDPEGPPGDSPQDDDGEPPAAGGIA